MSQRLPKTNESTPYDDGALYDILLGDGFEFGLDYYVGLAKAAGGPVLDVACGTGRILLPCLRAGVDVEGLDNSAGMLASLRKKAVAQGFHPQIHEADMCSFRLNRRYALIMVPFNAFVHNLTAADQISGLTRFREHLQPGGMLVFDSYFPSVPLITAPDNSRDLEMETINPSTGLIVRMFDTRSFDRVEQLQYSKIEIEMLDAAGNVTDIHRSETTVRWIYKAEMELLLRIAGFGRWQIFGGFDHHPLVRETDIMVVQAWNETGSTPEKPKPKRGFFSELFAKPQSGVEMR